MASKAQGLLHEPVVREKASELLHGTWSTLDQRLRLAAAAVLHLEKD